MHCYKRELIYYYALPYPYLQKTQHLARYTQVVYTVQELEPGTQCC